MREINFEGKPLVLEKEPEPFEYSIHGDYTAYAFDDDNGKYLIYWSKDDLCTPKHIAKIK